MLLKGLQQGWSRLRGGREISALADQALVSGSNFITNVILARSLGVAGFGVFALAWMGVLFMNSLQWAFIVSPMMSVGPKQEAQDRPLYYGSVLVQQFAFSLVSALAVLAVLRVASTRFPGWSVHGLALPLSLATFAYLLQDFMRRYFFTVRRSSMALLSDGISYVTQLPIIFFVARRPHFSSPAALWIIAVTSLAGFIIPCFWFEPVQVRFTSIRQVFFRHWKISRWLAPAAFMQWSSANLFIMAAPLYYGAAAAGILRASQNIVAVAHIWFLGLDNVVSAETSRRLHSKGLDDAFNYVKSILLRWGLITFAFVTVVALFPSFWLNLVYGHKFAAYGHILQLYAAFYMIVFFAGPLRNALQAMEYTAPIFWSYSAMTIFSLLFAGPFAKRLGLTGVMAGMIVTQVLFQAIIAVGLVLKVRRMRHALVLTELKVGAQS